MPIRKPLVAGTLFFVLGIAFAIQSYRTMAIGKLADMGPGYYPLILGIILALLGIGIAVQGFALAPTSWGSWSPRGLALLGLAPVLFAVVIQGLGLIPAVVLTTAVSAFASRFMTMRMASVVIVAVTLVCLVVFHWLVGLTIPLFGPWLPLGGF